MNIKIAGQSSKSNYRNTGSCGGAVTYSEHDLHELSNVLETLGVSPQDMAWFDMDGNVVSGAEVIDKIGRLTAHLGKEDAKFYCTMIDPSDDELLAIGDDINGQITRGQPFVFDVMDAYAENFHREAIKDRHDLVAYAIPHIYKSKGKQQVHWHVIQARLSRPFEETTEEGKVKTKHYKLSPLTNHRNTLKGKVIGGFDRIDFDAECERRFDARYNYQRRVENSFDYLLAKKKGSSEEKSVQETRLALQNIPELEESIKTAITRRVERLAREAAERAIKEKQAADEKARAEAARIEQANKNKFWNTYKTQYTPLIVGLQKSISDSFQMHDALKEDIKDCGREITERYDQLRRINEQIKRAGQDINKAANSKDLWTALAGLVAIVNPVAGLVIGLVGRIVAEANKSAAIETRKALYSKAKVIHEYIDELKEEQSQLRDKDAEVMRAVKEDKAAKQELFDEINALKAELTKPVEPPKPKYTFDFKAELAKSVEPTQSRVSFDFKVASLQSATPPTRSRMLATEATSPKGSSVDVYSILLAARDKDSLDLALLNKKVVMEPLKGRFGGVADFKVTIATEGRVVNASRLVSGDAERLRQMVDKWETLTGEQSAYKQEILADICSKMDVASPENAPRVPKNIVFHPGGEIDVTYTTKKGNTPTLRIGADGKVKVNNVLLDINTGKFTYLQGQTQQRKQSPGESQAPTGEKKSGGHKR